MSSIVTPIITKVLGVSIPTAIGGALITSKDNFKAHIKVLQMVSDVISKYGLDPKKIPEHVKMATSSEALPLYINARILTVKAFKGCFLAATLALSIDTFFQAILKNFVPINPTNNSLKITSKALTVITFTLVAMNVTTVQVTALGLLIFCKFNENWENNSTRSLKYKVGHNISDLVLGVVPIALYSLPELISNLMLTRKLRQLVNQSKQIR